MPKIKDITRYLETIAPLSFQESYDNAGLQTGDANAEVTGILLTLDCTETVVEEAIAKNCNLIVAHHPVIFRGLKKLTGSNYVEKTIIKAIKNDIAIYASHTNLDSVPEGVNFKIAEKIGLKNLKILSQKEGQLLKLVTFAPQEATEKVLAAMHQAGAGNIGDYKNCSYQHTGEGRFMPTAGADPYIGEQNKLEKVTETRIEVLVPRHLKLAVIDALIKAHPYEEVAYDIYALENVYQEMGAGMIGELEYELESDVFLKHLKQSMNLQVVKHTPFLNKPVKKVALCGGAGSFLIKDAIRQQADIYITGDLKYHEYFDAENKIVLADIGHYESEVFTKELFYDLISKKFPTFAVSLSEINTNPVRYS
jgi:dinuclear metal center YbgI/SA1388 family protein